MCLAAHNKRFRQCFLRRALFVVASCPRGQPRRNNLGGQFTQFGAQMFQFALGFAPQLFQRAPFQARVQIIAHFRKCRWQQVARLRNDAVFHLIGLVDKNNQNLVIGYWRELNMFDNRIGPGRQHKAGALAEAGKTVYCLFQQLFGAQIGLRVGRDNIAFFRRQFADLQQAVDKQSQAALCRQASGRHMRGI